MSISMHKASAPVFVRMLSNLDALLEKAEADATPRNYKVDVLLQSRLAPDMLPLLSQFQIASDSAKGAMARLSGTAAPSMPDTETTVAEVRQRLAKTIDYVKSFPADAIDGTEERDVVLKSPSGDIPFKGLAYLTGFALPNFFFHVTMAYAILRHNGVSIGKLDFLGRAPA